MKLSSTAFMDGSTIPSKYGYKYENINPPLKIDNIPENTASLVLIMDDPDALDAVGKIWVHWLLWNIPPYISQIEENSIPNHSLQGINDFGKIAYGGPAPPDKEHTYFFKLFALDSILQTEKGSTKKQIEQLMHNHVIAESLLKGRFSP